MSYLFCVVCVTPIWLLLQCAQTNLPSPFTTHGTVIAYIRWAHLSSTSVHQDTIVINHCGVSIRITVFVLPRVSVWLHTYWLFTTITAIVVFQCTDIIWLLNTRYCYRCVTDRNAFFVLLLTAYHRVKMFCVDVCTEHYIWPICNRLICCNCVSCVSCMKRLYPIAWLTS